MKHGTWNIKNSITRNMVLFHVMCFLLYVIDRLTKLFFIKNPEYVRDFWLFGFSYSLNKNIAFSIPIPQFLIYFFIILVLVFLFYLLIKNYKENKKIFVFILSLIIIGAVSNFLDRFIYGGVIDFIDVPYFTVFNLADSYIFIGVCLWLVVEMKNMDNKNLK